MQEAKVIELWRKVDNELKKTSPSFCLAKWKQTTLYLHTGFTHSCHHPISHKIDPVDVQSNPLLLHNTPEKMQYRQQMLNGERPEECDYCWRVEDMPGEHYSDRVQKSAKSWSWDYLDEVRLSGTGKDILPSYLEVVFESTCNFKCVYCQPDVSSRILEDIEQHGGYKLHDFTYLDLSYLKKAKKIPIHRKEYNPYVEAFWKWLPDLYPSLRTLRITGGEPLLSDHTWKLIDYIIDHPHPQLTFGINTNLGSPDKLIDKLIEKLNILKGKVKEVQVFSSLEATGEEAEYIRYGMNYWNFYNNCKKVIEQTDVLFTIMTTINVLSYSTLTNFIYEMSMMRSYAKDISKFYLSLNFLRYPQFLDIRLLPIKIKENIADVLNDYAVLLNDYPRHPSRIGSKQVLKVDECENLKRIVTYMMGQASEEERWILNLREYLMEQDRRRKTNYKRTFPLLARYIEDYYANSSKSV